ncbi:MAG: hypothetical protein R2794_11415 [Chitinophagales bacterium]
MQKQYLHFITICLITGSIYAQDSSTYTLRLNQSLVNMPAQSDLSYHFPSMQQSTELSNNLYDVSYWGIFALSNTLTTSLSQKTEGSLLQQGMYYALGAAFAYYGSELPIPLGVWNHENFHAAVLGLENIRPYNGNWLLNRWDGTVYGVSDEDMSALKATAPQKLLYAFVAGVGSETYATSQMVTEDVYYDRSFYKNPLYLYNAYYVWNYFRFSCSALSDSVKLIAPEYESADPLQRDFAGADLSAWVYDMFTPDAPFTDRDTFPNGTGVNRRIGFSDLSPAGQAYLQKQKDFALLNFVNPAIFMINRINLKNDWYFLPFMDYYPTPYGNSMALHVPAGHKNAQYDIAFRTYNNRDKTFGGLELAYGKPWTHGSKQFYSKVRASVWSQPESLLYSDEKGKMGFYCSAESNLALNDHWMIGLRGGYKSAGWVAGNAYLDATWNGSLQFRYVLLHK